MNIDDLIKNKNAKIVDVRTPNEYFGGNADGSINIPLSELPYRIEEIKALNSPIILCCASGIRSKVAADIVQKHDIECYNGGSWVDVMSCINC